MESTSSTSDEALRATCRHESNDPGKVVVVVGPTSTSTTTIRLDERQTFASPPATRSEKQTKMPSPRARRGSLLGWSNPSRAQLCVVLVAICVLIVGVDCEDQKDNRSPLDDTNNAISSSSESKDTSDSSSSRQLPDEQMLSTKEPRQQFRIHLGSGQSAAATKRTLKLQNNRRAGQQPVDSEQKAPKGQPDNKSNSKSKNVSSAALKKLLSQTLPKYQQSQLGLAAGAQTNSTGKGSNFKFVFIQRATAAPSAGPLGSTKSITSTSARPTGGTGGHHKAPFASSTSSQTSLPTGHKSSLAASISKQLASSLLYSAANLMSNLTAPSISTLASHQQHQQQPDIVPSDDQSANDIKRIQAANSSSSWSPTNSPIKSKSNQAATRKSRPSKVYNLPLKFVSNGQANSVMFHTIKQHFATIKKLQSMAGTASAGTKINSFSSSSSSQGKRRKPNTSSTLHNRLKGTNSRLIYLPLKYLSNARSTGIMSTKASHKLLKSSAKTEQS